MSSDAISETEMREALGLASPDAPAKPAVNPGSRPPRRCILVELSVRPQDGGKPFRFEYRSRSLSSLEARLEAEKAVRKQGLTVWAVLDIRHVDD